MNRISDRIKIALWLSSVLNVLLLSIFIIIMVRNKEKVMQKLILVTGDPEVVMFGDSHTANADWTYLLRGSRAIGTGYPGFTSGQLKNMLMTKVLKYMPQYCFIQCGGNDINNGCFERDSLIKNVSVMIDTLKAHSVRPVVQSLFYRFGDRDYNHEIDTLNTLLQDLAFEKSTIFLDINSFLSDSMSLKQSLNIDGKHLNKEGYDIWAGQIIKFLSTMD
ncbi:MAG: hypothetical protein FJY07_12445 [Bacteroidetes bacterium]|nr:hypothetical protein [Bacteroidota bacterium]